MALEFLNPLDRVIETKVSPHARCLRTSFTEKLKDAFLIFAGDWRNLVDHLNHPDSKLFLPKHIGLLDLLTLGIPAAFFIFTLSGIKSKNLLVKGLAIFLGILNLPLLLARFLVAAVLAFNPLSLFIIGMVHLASQYLAGGAALKNKVVTFIKKMTENENNTFTTNREYPMNGKDQIDKFREYNDDQLAIDSLNVMLSDRRTAIHFAMPSRDRDKLISFVWHTPSVFYKNSNNNADREEFEKALLKLNCGGITNEIEALNDNDDESPKRLLNLIEPPRLT